jgi:hypothetical protein
MLKTLQGNISDGDMSSSNGSDPWQQGVNIIAATDIMEPASGLDIAFRYLNKTLGTQLSKKAPTATDPDPPIQSTAYNEFRNFEICRHLWRLVRAGHGTGAVPMLPGMANSRTRPTVAATIPDILDLACRPD